MFGASAARDRLPRLWNDSCIHLHQRWAICKGMAFQPSKFCLLPLRGCTNPVALDSDFPSAKTTLSNHDRMGLSCPNPYGRYPHGTLDLETSNPDRLVFDIEKLLIATDIMNPKKIDIGGSHLDVIDVGEGPTILFVHGFPLDHRMWKFQIEHLAEKFRLICPDLPGFGKSPASHNRPTMRGFAEDLAALLSALNIEQPVCYCGLSMGGYIGWQFQKYFPNRVSRLIACDTRAASDTEQVRRARKIAAQPVMTTGAAPVAESMIEKLFYHRNVKHNKKMVTEVREVISSTQPSSIASGQLAMSERPDQTERLSQINIPTLFVVGEFDKITTPQEMQENSSLVPNSSLLKIPDAGHLPPLENHIEFNRGLVEFLDPSMHLPLPPENAT